MMEGVAPRRRVGPSREEKKAETRAKLLEAAGVVFARSGLAGASLDDVADEAGLTKGAVYSNFESKEDLIRALLEERLGGPSQAIPPLIDSTLPQDEQAAQAGAMFMNLVANEHDAYLLELEFMLYVARNPELRNPEGYLQRRRAMADIMERRAGEAGIPLPIPAEELTTALFCLGAGIAMERLVNPDHVPEDLFGKMLMVIFAGTDPGSASSE
jgi:AcrR family transcriptional regulator